MKVKIGNIFESQCDTIVNTVNCVGVMGKGIALEYRKRYPAMFEDYVRKCDAGEVKPGVPYVYHCEDGRRILNFPTKDHWRSPSRLSYVVGGLDWVASNYRECGDSIAFPPLGCGNGGLDWEVVGPVMYQRLSRLPIAVEIYAPFGTSQNELTESFLSCPGNEEDVVGKGNLKVSPKWYLILQVVRELNERKYSLKVGRTIYQKICYVLTRNGVNTGFKFARGSYGPFSAEVKDSVAALANANLIVEKKLGKMISLCVADGVEIHKEKFTYEEWEAVRKTVDLFGRVKCTEQAEMIATVLYAYDELAKAKTAVSDKEVYDAVFEWKRRWKDDKEYEVCNTIQKLAMLSLIRVSCSKELMETE